MPPGTPGTPPAVAALVLLAAVGSCLVAVASFVPAVLGGLGAWPGVAIGLVALVVALVALWIIQHRRDRTMW